MSQQCDVGPCNFPFVASWFSVPIEWTLYPILYASVHFKPIKTCTLKPRVLIIYLWLCLLLSSGYYWVKLDTNLELDLCGTPKGSPGSPRETQTLALTLSVSTCVRITPGNDLESVRASYAPNEGPKVSKILSPSSLLPANAASGTIRIRFRYILYLLQFRTPGPAHAWESPLRAAASIFETNCLQKGQL